MTVVANSVSFETQEYIDVLVGLNYDLDSIYEFIEEYGEQNFNDYYEEYVESGEKQSYESVDAFVEEFGIENVSHFEDAFYGVYSSERDFVDNFMLDNVDHNIPNFISIDYSGTMDNLNDDFAFTEGGFVFNRNF